MVKSTSFSLGESIPDVDIDQVNEFKNGAQDTTVRAVISKEKIINRDEIVKKREKIYERYTFSLTPEVSKDIDSISFMPGDFRANRSDVIKAGISLLKSMPKGDVIEQLRKVK